MTTTTVIVVVAAAIAWGLICGRIGYVMGREDRDITIPGTDPDDWRGQ